MIKLSALWENTDKNGNPCFSGYLGDSKILVFKNGHKTEPKHPDYIVYLDEKKKKESDAVTPEVMNSSDELPF